MVKGIIYYTDNRLDEPIFSIVQNEILKSNLPIVSVSLKPINFGKNIVLNLKPGIVSMIIQIKTALENSCADYVFFCEHDVLYPISHFDFTPKKDNIFYYNANIYRWDYPHNRAITYDRLICLSGLAVNRKFALEHYSARLKKIIEKGYDKLSSREPSWARTWGYEPGTKKRKRGGFSNDDFETWTSNYPIVDIRHKKTFSPPKVTPESFKHKPLNFREVSLNKIPGWNLAKLLTWLT